MSDLKGLRVIVAGAGAIGSVVALRLARRGAQVTLADPAEIGDNASGVAAGMLAPACETLLDAESAGRFALLRAAREAWTPLLAELPAAPPLDRSGAILQAAAPEVLLARAAQEGVALTPLREDEARDLAPGLTAPGPWLYTPDDWRIEPRGMLQALHGAFGQAGGLRTYGRLAGFADRRAVFDGAEDARADMVIAATGQDGIGLEPIKGQILRFPGAGPLSGPVVRAEGIYIAPSPQGALAGATMEAGVSDRRIDPQVVAKLRAAAARLFPSLSHAQAQAYAGVRAATPDGLPLVGPGADEGLLLARGARRNGWLLAPVVAQVILDRIEGRAPSAFAAAFDPARFR